MTHPTRALILAGGGRTGQRWPWPNPLGFTRHMVPIDGVPLIHRTTRQLAERGVTDIRVMADPDCGDYITPPAVRETPRLVGRAWVQEWEPSQHLWAAHGRTMILYGDTYFTDPLMDAMCADPGSPWNVYARFNGSATTGKRYGEMFGWVFTADEAPLLIHAQREAIWWRESGRWHRALGWEVYRIAVGLRPSVHARTTHFVDWDDRSDDFDTPQDWRRWSALKEAQP